MFCQNHDHNCVATCAKYANKNTGAKEPGVQQKKRRVDLREHCRFLFVRLIELLAPDNAKKLAKKNLRRGKEIVQMHSLHVAMTEISLEKSKSSGNIHFAQHPVT